MIIADTDFGSKYLSGSFEICFSYLVLPAIKNTWLTIRII